jgi:hypothetical protein
MKMTKKNQYKAREIKRDYMRVKEQIEGKQKKGKTNRTRKGMKSKEAQSDKSKATKNKAKQKDDN